MLTAQDFHLRNPFSLAHDVGRGCENQ